jgi:hypothetical protein
VVAVTISTAVITWRVTTPIVIAIAPIETRASVVGVRRITRIVIRCGIRDVVTTGIVITTGKAQAEYAAEQQSTKHGGLLKDPQPVQAG